MLTPTRDRFLVTGAVTVPRDVGDARFVRPVSRWLPAGPLIAVLESHCRARSLRALARATGIDRRTFERLRHRQRIRSDSADRIAVALGRHPSEIWPEWFPGGNP
jgi:lambda repressor-like predicted transcriptional regulator